MKHRIGNYQVVKYIHHSWGIKCILQNPVNQVTYGRSIRIAVISGPPSYQIALLRSLLKKKLISIYEKYNEKLEEESIDIENFTRYISNIRNKYLVFEGISSEIYESPANKDIWEIQRKTQWISNSISILLDNNIEIQLCKEKTKERFLIIAIEYGTLCKIADPIDYLVNSRKSELSILDTYENLIAIDKLVHLDKTDQIIITNQGIGNHPQLIELTQEIINHLMSYNYYNDSLPDNQYFINKRLSSNLKPPQYLCSIFDSNSQNSITELYLKPDQSLIVKSPNDVFQDWLSLHVFSNNVDSPNQSYVVVGKVKPLGYQKVDLENHGIDLLNIIQNEDDSLWLLYLNLISNILDVPALSDDFLLFMDEIIEHNPNIIQEMSDFSDLISLLEEYLHEEVYFSDKGVVDNLYRSFKRLKYLNSLGSSDNNATANKINHPNPLNHVFISTHNIPPKHQIILIFGFLMDRYVKSKNKRKHDENKSSTNVSQQHNQETITVVINDMTILKYLIERNVWYIFTEFQSKYLFFNFIFRTPNHTFLELLDDYPTLHLGFRPQISDIEDDNNERGFTNYLELPGEKTVKVFATSTSHDLREKIIQIEKNILMSSQVQSENRVEDREIKLESVDKKPTFENELPHLDVTIKVLEEEKDSTT